MFGELIATEGVEEVYWPGGPVGVMAIHGGLEEGTAPMAEVVAEATTASLYSVVQPPSLWWHVPSIRYDPAESQVLASFIGSVRTAISLHGYGEPGFETVALLGGNNRTLAAGLHVALAARGIESLVDLDSIPRRLRGVHRRNPVNLPPDAGVQVELPMALREGRRYRLVADAIASVIASEAKPRADGGWLGSAPA
ncbi:MAG: hypothetical protein HKN91_03970 [Acidimicrobiia bacterium]|nr:hypothetical protein [Acidimicrobiia bacterium]